MTARTALVLAPALLVVSNIFMTYAWYGHLKDLKSKAFIIRVNAIWSHGSGVWSGLKNSYHRHVYYGIIGRFPASERISKRCPMYRMLLVLQ